MRLDPSAVFIMGADAAGLATTSVESVVAGSRQEHLVCGAAASCRAPARDRTHSPARVALGNGGGRRAGRAQKHREENTRTPRANHRLGRPPCSRGAGPRTRPPAADDLLARQQDAHSAAAVVCTRDGGAAARQSTAAVRGATQYRYGSCGSRPRTGAARRSRSAARTLRCSPARAASGAAGSPRPVPAAAPALGCPGPGARPPARAARASGPSRLPQPANTV